MDYVRVCARAAALLGVLVAPALVGAQAFDAIGPSSAQSNGTFFLSSTSNTDVAGDFWTAAGVGTITLAPGKRVDAVEAVIGTRGPNGVGPINFGAITQWEVHVWSSLSAFASAPLAGNSFNRAFAQPSNPGYSTPFGVDESGQPTYRVRFHIPGGIAGLTSGQTYHFAIRARISYSTVGYMGVVESSVAGLSGLQAGWGWPPPGYVVFNSPVLAAVRKHNGVLAYRLGEGCRADFDGSGAVDINDIFVFLNAWFGGAPGSNFDEIGGTDINDIFVFLNQWFSGC